MEYKYNVGELKRFIAESSKNEFSPVIGAGVESTDKSNNRKAYKDAQKRVKDFDEGGKEYEPSNKKVEPNGDDFNGTTLGYEFNNDPGKDYTERVKHQASGHYAGKMGAENGIEQDPSVEFNDKSYNYMKDREEKRQKAKADRKGSGLVGSEQEKHDPDIFKKNPMFENVKTVQFKHNTKFLNEAHMISRIPDEMKLEGQKFHMKDGVGNDYLVEWNHNNANVISHTNPIELNENLARMRALAGYNPEINTKTKRKQL